MPFKKILCPVDLSENSLSALAMAATLAESDGAQLILLHVAIPPIHQEAMFAGDDVEDSMERDQREFNALQPSQDVACEHVFLRGNPGPETVNYARENDCDLIVLATHGRTGLLRMLMGSVAEYISRHSSCPVLSLNTQKAVSQDEGGEDAEGSESGDERTSYVTHVMKHVSPIQSYDKMGKVMVELETVGATAAPVIGGLGHCTGILTSTDIARYRDLKRRFAERDPSVIPEMFEVDEFGQRRTNNVTFEQVQRHMTAPVVTISASASCDDAINRFLEHPKIHHLVVVDESNHPLGVIDLNSIPRNHLGTDSPD